MKADRLLSAMLLLQARGRMSGRELAERLEVSQRTIHRDMEALSAARVPITAIRGAQGGWQLDKDWRTQVPAMDAAELNALLMTQPRTLGDPTLVAAAERAFAKLMAALPSRMREQAAAMRERLHVDATGWRPSGEDLSMLPLVQEAVARDCKITFDYTRADGEMGPRTVDPLGIVAKGSSWYLVARAPHGLRTYKISRMRAVAALAAKFERPANFDLAAHWKQSTTQLQQKRQFFEALLAIDPEAAKSISVWCATRTIPARPETPPGWLTLQVDFDTEDQARFVVLGLAHKAIALAPETLCQRVLTDAEAIVAKARSLESSKRSRGYERSERVNRVSRKRITEAV